ncbi:MAG: hypothetical protein VXB01_17335, partial [Opitutae bacterium]
MKLRAVLVPFLDCLAGKLVSFILLPVSLSAFASEIPIDLPPPPPEVEAFSLEDLIAAGNREKTLKEEWAVYQSRLEAAFKEAKNFETSSDNPELSQIAWQRFIETFAADNPYSDQDNLLLQRARAMINPASRVAVENVAKPISEQPVEIEAELSDPAEELLEKRVAGSGDAQASEQVVAITKSEPSLSVDSAQEAELTEPQENSPSDDDAPSVVVQISEEQFLNILSEQDQFIYFSNSEGLVQRFIANLKVSQLTELYPSLVQDIIYKLEREEDSSDLVKKLYS